MFTGLLATPLCRPGIIILACNTISPIAIPNDPVRVSETTWKDWTKKENKARVEPKPVEPRVEVVDEPTQQPFWPNQPTPITNAGPSVIVVEKTTHAHLNQTVVEVHHHTHQHFHAAVAPDAPVIAAAAPAPAPLALPAPALITTNPAAQLKYLLIVGGLVLGGILLIATLSTPSTPPKPKKRRRATG